jgi:thymidylate synthase ThyX
VDVSRFILPASALANVGMTANGRVLENTIRKMRSHPLAEIRQIGEEIKAACQREIPTLVKYAEPVPYLIETAQALNKINHGLSSTVHGHSDWCNLISYDEDGEQRILAAALYRFGEMSYAQALDHIASLTKPEFDSLADALLGRLGRHDIPLRELEYATYTFDLIMDQGAYAEFKRHRMMTQTPQLLTCHLGYTTPKRIVEAGFESEYNKAMDAASALYEKLYAFNPNVAQYVVPNAFNRRVLATFNLREAYHFCSLRAAANAHFSIRKVAQRVAEEIRRVHPHLSKSMSLHTETWQGIEDEHFAN